MHDRRVVSEPVVSASEEAEDRERARHDNAHVFIIVRHACACVEIGTFLQCYRVHGPGQPTKPSTLALIKLSLYLTPFCILSPHNFSALARFHGSETLYRL